MELSKFKFVKQRLKCRMAVFTLRELPLQQAMNMFVILVLCNGIGGIICEPDSSPAQTRVARERPGLPDDKIRGGRRVESIIERPYMSYLLIGPLVHCTGTIVTSLYVLTACHCLVFSEENEVHPTTEPLDTWRILAGAVNIRAYSERTLQLRIPQSFSYHPECKVEPIVQNDAGLVKVSKPFNFSAYAEPVKILFFELESELNSLTNKAKTGSPAQCIVSGWGKSQYQSLADILGCTANQSTRPPEPVVEDPFQLKTINHSFLSYDECLYEMVVALEKDAPECIASKGFKEPELHDAIAALLNGFICGTSKYKNESTCGGDSGAGFICDGSIIGINSWGWGCGSSEPDAFQSLLPVFDWFQSELCTVRTCQDALNLHKDCPTPSTSFMTDCAVRGNREIPEAISIPSGCCTLAPLWLAVLILPLIKQ